MIFLGMNINMYLRLLQRVTPTVDVPPHSVLEAALLALMISVRPAEKDTTKQETLAQVCRSNCFIVNVIMSVRVNVSQSLIAECFLELQS